MSALVSYCRSHASSCYRSTFCVEGSRDDHSAHASRSESRVSQYAFGQVFVLWRHFETFLDKAINANRFWRVGEQANIAECLATNFIDLTSRKIRGLVREIGAESLHFLSVCFFCFSSLLLTNSSSSSALIFL